MRFQLFPALDLRWVIRQGYQQWDIQCSPSFGSGAPTSLPPTKKKDHNKGSQQRVEHPQAESRPPTKKKNHKYFLISLLNVFGRRRFDVEEIHPFGRIVVWYKIYSFIILFSNIIFSTVFPLSLLLTFVISLSHWRQNVFDSEPGGEWLSLK